MRLLILIGLIIIFISTFFILFTVDSLVAQLGCPAGDVWCHRVAGIPLVAGLIMIGIFITIDLLVMYLMITSLQTLDFPARELP